MKTFLFGCGGLMIGLIIGIVLMLGANSFLQSSNSPNIILPEPTSAAGKSDVALVISANYLNAQLKPLLAKNAPIKQPTISLAAPNLVKLAGAFDLLVAGQRVSTNAAIALKVAVQKARVVLTVDKIEAGGVNVPPSLIESLVETFRAQAEDQLNTLVQNSLKGTLLKLANVRISPTDLTLELTGQ